MADRLHLAPRLSAWAWTLFRRTRMTDESLSAHVEAARAVRPDPSLFSHLRAGRRSAELELWLEALEHADEEAWLVVDALARKYGRRLAPPDEEAPELGDAIAATSRANGETMAKFVEKMADGAVSQAEAVEMLPLFEEAEAKAAAGSASCRAMANGRPYGVRGAK